MSVVEITCAFCGLPANKRAGDVNRSRKQGYAVYCGRKCAGIGRRQNKSAEELKERKRLYDIQYRAKNAQRLKAEKAAYYQRTRDPEKERAIRKAKMAQHVEYCRRPEYRAYKKQYDREYRARMKFGSFWESHMLLVDLETEVNSQASRYEVYMEKGTINKMQKRKRDYEKSYCR
ncbi:hypothetical protein HBA54_28055 [Pelagibius litoralis]|uniref:Uncharacterized protein n=1 Tax=Pelagibius litoralis TaxID=374515 RepID=A0A967F3A9_9PROT|nr:hypothetical protein [Pelagibius litoralis]NIA72446.1 hypothetical protein [Pelagibius litoralis]